MTPAERGDRMAELYRQGVGTGTIASRWGVHPRVVLAALKRRAVEMRPAKGGRSPVVPVEAGQ